MAAKKPIPKTPEEKAKAFLKSLDKAPGDGELTQTEIIAAKLFNIPAIGTLPGPTTAGVRTRGSDPDMFDYAAMQALLVDKFTITPEVAAKIIDATFTHGVPTIKLSDMQKIARECANAPLVPKPTPLCVATGYAPSTTITAR